MQPYLLVLEVVDQDSQEQVERDLVTNERASEGCKFVGLGVLEQVQPIPLGLGSC